jgi:hypothetical protein
LASEKNATRSFVTTLQTLLTKFGDGPQGPIKIDFKPLEDVKERGNMVESETRSNGLVK